MKKFLLAALAAIPCGVSAAGFAMAIDLSPFEGGLSVLDSLLLIAVGLTLIGVLLLCIAMFKGEKPAEPAEEASEVIEADEAEIPEPAAEAEPESPENAEEETPQTEETEDAAEPAEARDVPETPEQKYPKLTLTGTNNGEFKVLQLKEQVTIGRRAANDLVLSDAAISGVHCTIIYEDGAAFVQDNDSTNGTFLNGDRVLEKTPLKKGDLITLGQMEFRVGL